MKKWFFLLVCTAVILVCASAASEKVGGTAYWHTGGPMSIVHGGCTNITWILDTEEGILTVGGSGEWTGYYDGRPPWGMEDVEMALDDSDHFTDTHDYRPFIKKVIIGDGILNIANNAFEGCTNLTDVLIPSSVTSVDGNAFKDCPNLEKLENDRVYGDIGYRAFRGTALTNVTIMNAVTIEVEAFNDCTKLKSVTMQDTVTSVGSSAFSGCSQLSGELVLSESLRMINEEAFAGCESLTAIRLPASLKQIDECAFYECNSLTELDLPSGITSIAHEAFDGWNGTRYAKIGSDTAAAMSAEDITFRDRSYPKLDLIYVFTEDGTNKGLQLVRADTDITEVVFPDEIAEINSGAFSNCKLLSGELVLPESIRAIYDDTFAGCESLTAIKLPDGLERIDGFVFYECNNLTELDLPSGITSIAHEAFNGWNGTRYAKISSGTAVAMSVEDITFRDRNCPAVDLIHILSEAGEVTGLQAVGADNAASAVSIPEGVTSVAESAFSDCAELTSVTLPLSLSRVESYAFDNCVKLATVYFAGSEEQWKKIVVESGNDPLLNAVILYNGNTAISLSDAKISAIRDQEYTGKAVRPELTVKVNGRTLIPDLDYTVSFSNNKNIGKATAKITGIGSYSGTKSASFKIIPKKVAVSSLKPGKKSLTFKWKAGKGIDGYEIEYGLKKDFKGSKKITVSRAKTTSCAIKQLKAKKTYYVRIRAFRKVKGKKYYSVWSKVLSKKTK